MKKSRFFTQDKTVYALLLFFLIVFSDMLATLTGFGGATVLLFAFGSDMPMFSSCESLIISACAICLVLLVAFYSYTKNHPKKLKAIAASNIIMSLLPFMMNSLYYPFPDMISHTIYRITDIEYFYASDLDHYLSMFVSVPICTLCFILLFKLKKRGRQNSASTTSFRRISCVAVTAFVLVTVVGLAVCNILPSEAYNRSAFVYLGEAVAENLKKTGDERLTEKFFESITSETDYSQADAFLRGEGYIPHTEIENYIEEQEQCELLIDNLGELMKDGETLVYTKPHDGFISYYSDCILLMPDETGKVKKKTITYDTDSPEKTEEAEESFRELKIGDEKESVLKQMKKVSDISSVSVEYREDTVRESYTLSAFHDTSFLSLVCITWFEGTVVFENGILTDGNYTYTLETNAETDDVVCTEQKYTITE